MLQLQRIREDKDAILQALKKRNIDADTMLNSILQLDEKRRTIQTELDSTLSESNKLSKEIGMLFKSGRGRKPTNLSQKRPL